MLNEVLVQERQGTFYLMPTSCRTQRSYQCTLRVPILAGDGARGLTCCVSIGGTVISYHWSATGVDGSDEPCIEQPSLATSERDVLVSSTGESDRGTQSS